MHLHGKKGGDRRTYDGAEVVEGGRRVDREREVCKVRQENEDGRVGGEKKSPFPVIGCMSNV